MDEEQKFLGEIKEEELAKNLKGKSRSITVVIVLMLPVILFLAVMIKKFIDVRITEINQSISSTQKVSEGNKSHHMLVNYFLISQKMKRQEESEDLYIQEAAFQMTLPEIEAPKELKEDSFLKTIDASLDGLAKWIIDGIRLLMFKSETESMTTIYENPDLQKAYVLERNRKFDKATETYSQILAEENLTDELTSYILLHRGYCIGQLAKYQEAIEDMDTIINTYGIQSGQVNSNRFIQETVDVASQLKKIMTSLLNETDKIENNEDLNLFEKGKSYYFVGNYNKAIDNLKAYTETDGPNTNEAYFFYARSLEETGRSSEAMDIYKKLQNTEFGRNAADRMIMAATIYKDPAMSESMAESSISAQNRNADFIHIIEALSGKEDSAASSSNNASGNEFYSAMQDVLNNNVQSFTMVLRNEETVDMNNAAVVMVKGLQDDSGVMLSPEIINMAPPEGFSNAQPVAPPLPVIQQPGRADNDDSKPANANNTALRQMDNRFNQLQARMNINKQMFRPMDLPFPEDSNKENIPYQLPPTPDLDMGSMNPNPPEPLATHLITIDGKTMVGIISRELGNDYILFKPKGDERETLMLKRSDVIIESLHNNSQENPNQNKPQGLQEQPEEILNESPGNLSTEATNSNINSMESNSGTIE